jgi:hypothetical protein
METAIKTYKIFFDQEINSVVMEWRGYANSSEFKEGTELMLNTLIKNHAYKVLADVRDMTLIGMEDQQWINTVFLPRAMEFDFKVLAIVRPNHYFNKVAVENISEKVDKNKLAIEFFDTAEHAKEWLSLVP